MTTIGQNGAGELYCARCESQNIEYEPTCRDCPAKLEQELDDALRRVQELEGTRSSDTWRCNACDRNFELPREKRGARVVHPVPPPPVRWSEVLAESSDEPVSFGQHDLVNLTHLAEVKLTLGVPVNDPEHSQSCTCDLCYRRALRVLHELFLGKQ